MPTGSPTISVSALLLAAGHSRRMGGGPNKVLRLLDGKPVLVHSLIALAKADEVDGLVIVANPQDYEQIRTLLHQFADGAWGKKPTWRSEQLVVGGDERQDSIWNGLQSLPEDCNWVIVHDGARPYASPSLFLNLVATAKHKGNVIPAIPVLDTIKQVDDDLILSTLDRNVLRAAQTPQVFRYPDLLLAHRKARQDSFHGTDDAQLLERIGIPVTIAQGEITNKKITYVEDFLDKGTGPGQPEPSPAMIRIGFGYDIHRLEPNHPCVLCGVEVPSPLGMVGHSDADVPVHALMDAMLGAAGMRDIGTYFPNDDPAYKQISSLVLLQQVVKMISANGWEVINADLTIIAEEPKLQPHIPEMIRQLSEVLGVPHDRLAIKATTHEQVGEIGQSKAIAGYAVVQLQKVLLEGNNKDASTK